MCGRYYVATEEEIAEIREIIEEVARNLGKNPVEASMKTGEIFPTDVAPVLAPPLLNAPSNAAPSQWDAERLVALRQNGGALPFHAGGWQWRLAKWGFPHWQGKRPIINARSESAAEKPMFRRALQASRCAVPATGFFEWRRVGKTAKEKYLFKREDGRLLYMAGLADVFRAAGAGAGVGTRVGAGIGVGAGMDAGAGMGAGAYEAFTILTTAANESVADIHDRMPVILDREELDMWASDMSFVEEALRRPGPELVRVAA
jgi:putative SOS response-associated peptidase YedK